MVMNFAKVLKTASKYTHKIGDNDTEGEVKYRKVSRKFI